MDTFCFGLIADPQYADKAMSADRYYRHSLSKTQKAMDICKHADVDFLVCLGDVIDGADNPWLSERDCLRIQEIILGLEKPCHYLLGNHDVNAVHRQRLIDLWQFPDTRGYYTFHHKGTQFIMLDTNYDASGAPYLPGLSIWDQSHINEAQLKWLAEELSASSAGRCLVFTHALLDGAEERHTVKNAPQVRRILEQSGKQLAVFQGHYHAGHSSLVNGIPYYTLMGMVDGPLAYSCWILRLSPEGIHADIHTDEGLTRINVSEQDRYTQ